MQFSGLNDQEQWQLLNASASLKALANMNAAQAGPYRKDASILTSLQNGLLRRQLIESVDKIQGKQDDGFNQSEKNGSTDDDSSSKSDKNHRNVKNEKPNLQHIQMFNKGETHPHNLRDGEYYFVEETSVIGNIVLGHTVLFDEDKYAEYQYLGLAVGKSIVPADHLWVKGYVNNIYQVQDYEGPFFNMAAGIGPFGASASLGYNKNRNVNIVAGSEVAQQIFAGLSMSYQNYHCFTPDWVHDEAPITWGDTIYDHAFGNYDPEDI